MCEQAFIIGLLFNMDIIYILRLFFFK